MQRPRKPLLPWRHAPTLFGLLVVATLACGGVRSAGQGSETHWLRSCDTDAECGAGSCDCGVCTLECEATTDCSALGIDGVQCTPTASCAGAGPVNGAGAMSANGAAMSCALPCAADGDCNVLGGDARCESGRCKGGELAAGVVAPSGSADIGALCDGSEDVRVVNKGRDYYFLEQPFQSPGEFFPFAARYGAYFLAIDGQCRFWRSSFGAPVTTGVLSAEVAEQLARGIRFGTLSRWSDVTETVECVDAGPQILWTPEGSISCACGCTTDLNAPAEWRAAFAALTEYAPELTGAPVTGPAQVAMVVSGGGAAFPQAWPLSISPLGFEAQLQGIDESSGVTLTNAAELAALRATRQEHAELRGFSPNVPITWIDPMSQAPMDFDLLRNRSAEPLCAG